MTTSEDSAVASLRTLGFNHLEAEVYIFLLASPPTTAYRVAQQIAKPTANVYKAVEALARKGAVMLEEGENRVCRAVPVADFCRRAERDYRASLTAASEALSHLEPSAPDERVYRIESPSQVFELARDMIRTRARKVIVVDAFPGALSRIQDELAAAARRRVHVFVESYHPLQLPGAVVAHSAIAAAAPDHWKSEQLNLIVDGREHLIALLSRDLQSVYQAIWSNSLYLSCIHHGGRLCEHTLIRMLQAADSGATAEQVLRILREHQFFLESKVPGQQELMRRYVDQPAGGAKKGKKPR